MGCYFGTGEKRFVRIVRKTNYELPEYDYCRKIIGIMAIHYYTVSKIRDTFEQLTTNNSFINDAAQMIGQDDFGSYIYRGRVDKDNNRSGMGLCLYSTGKLYEGFWKNDYRNGEGTLIWPSGNYYTGDWVDNKMHGQGCMYSDRNNEFKKGVWENNDYSEIRNSPGNLTDKQKNRLQSYTRLVDKFEMRKRIKSRTSYRENKSNDDVLPRPTNGSKFELGLNTSSESDIEFMYQHKYNRFIGKEIRDIRILYDRKVNNDLITLVANLDNMK